MKNQPAGKIEISKWKTMFRNMPVKYKFILLVAILLISVSSIMHRFGPYEGKVVDLKTGMPLKGAVVLVRFKTDGLDASSAYAGAVEVMTDDNGKFMLPAIRVFVFHPFHRWNKNGYITIFKPGYGAYPYHQDVAPMFVPNGTIPQKQHVIFKLPKLTSIECRRDNLSGVRPSGSVPNDKIRKLLQLIAEERASIGLSN